MRRDALARILGGIGAALILATGLISADAWVYYPNPCVGIEDWLWWVTGCWLL